VVFLEEARKFRGRIEHTGSSPMSRFWRNVGSAPIRAISSRSLTMIGCGVPAGATRPK
jgi:hypothetical protein